MMRTSSRLIISLAPKNGVSNSPSMALKARTMVLSGFSTSMTNFASVVSPGFCTHQRFPSGSPSSPSSNWSKISSTRIQNSSSDSSS